MAAFAGPVVGTGAATVYELDGQGRPILRRPNGQVTTDPLVGRRTIVTPVDPVRPAVVDAGIAHQIIAMPPPGVQWCLFFAADNLAATIEAIQGHIDLASQNAQNRLRQFGVLDPAEDGGASLVEYLKAKLLRLQRGE